MEWLTSSEALLSLLTLTIMEIVLGIDNIVFISIQTDKLPEHQQKKGRILGLAFALFTRVVLLLSITWVLTLTKPLFNAANWLNLTGSWVERLSFSGRDLILLVGGLFLLYKSIIEIYNMLEGEHKVKVGTKLSFAQTVIQIGLLDIVFGLDSVITAVGMASHVEIMIIAIVIAMIIMVFSIHSISNFVNKHPSVKVLALSFLLLIGVSLMAESIDEPIAKGYIYFSMGFSMFVVMLVIRLKPGGNATL
ncbi:TerC family protein [Seonamhaeicola algicola]|uniref:TerC family protein n=1 Tax=Seonamhaeicola algicola TaxID=1719036 RepID=A0A5C7AE96_9FLAO|nr:TerC family protein [Seonamhaeicola algicola]TXE07046.1 TerC family protein [Seonamhaeicola algicola]